MALNYPKHKIGDLINETKNHITESTQKFNPIQFEYHSIFS
jgi:Txe/YoeB family toxin of Txe-Axe toxin-antitoxin module